MLPEAFVEDLPFVARVEVQAGLIGPLREAIAAAEPTEMAVEPLRDQVVERLSGRAGLLGAVMLADQVYLGRLVREGVPAIVAVGCLHWYGSYRSHTGRGAQAVGSLLELEDAWLRSPADRARREEAMRRQSVSPGRQEPRGPARCQRVRGLCG